MTRRSRTLPTLVVPALLVAASCASTNASPDGGGSQTDGGPAPDAGGPRPDGGGTNPIVGHGAFFEGDAFFYEDISDAPVRSDSSAITSWMVDYTTNDAETGPHGFGTGSSQLRIDFSIVVNTAPANTTKYPFDLDPDYYYPPDCDHAPMPLPAGGAGEQTYGVDPDLSGPLSGFECAGFDDGDDCHLIVFAPEEDRLYEIYHATRRPNGDFIGGCQAIFSTTADLGSEGRGQHCSSADAGGFPIAPMLFTADEIAAGEITHAIRFILPNPMIVNRHYVAPATHATNSGGPTSAVPYGARLRLRADFPLETLSAGARVIAVALQRYGMILADGGQVALTAESDLFSVHSWDEVGVDSYSLSSIDATDFEVIEAGPSIYDTWNCTRTALTQ
ncbi:MAG: hypothetical protein R3B40_15315 [Polyangiales bacterium]|nr:hypothetical protein [Myxococcales bacterium]MCB9658330.1 hypothetical protein [Sandaracinaceae bacterium]